MEQPALFDQELGVAMENATADQALAMLANDPRIVSDLADALERHDVDSKKHGWAGSSRSQVVRNTVTQSLAALPVP